MKMPSVTTATAVILLLTLLLMLVEPISATGCLKRVAERRGSLRSLRVQMRQMRLELQHLARQPSKSSRGLAGESTKSIIGPRWIWDASFEKPADEVDMGSWSAHVDQWGHSVPEAPVVAPVAP